MTIRSFIPFYAINKDGGEEGKEKNINGFLIKIKIFNGEENGFFLSKA